MGTATYLYAFLALLTIASSSESSHLPETVKRLRFYVQDKVAGDDRTVWTVAETNFSQDLPSKFGLVNVLDNPITELPDKDSQVLGRLQGVIALSDFKEMALSMLLNVLFTDGEYKGSTLSILGRNPLHDGVREVPVVAGTGAFRLARGYVITTTYESSEGYGVYEYDVVLFVPQYLTQTLDDKIMNDCR